MHPDNDALCTLPLRVRAQRADERCAGHHVRLDVDLQHLIKQLNRPLPQAAHRAGADGRCICMPCRMHMHAQMHEPCWTYMVTSMILSTQSAAYFHRLPTAVGADGRRESSPAAATCTLGGVARGWVAFWIVWSAAIWLSFWLPFLLSERALTASVPPWLMRKTCLWTEEDI